MFIMSEISTTDFTGIARVTKNSLDVFFRIPLKENAISIVKEMKKRNTKINASSLGDLDEKLLKILSNDENYMSENKKLPDKTEAKSLFEKSYEDAKSREDKKSYKNKTKVSMFDDIERNAQVIEQYENYVKKLKSINELDVLFLDKLNAVYSKYKSSSDYMERLVRRLLKNNFNYTDTDLKGETTRVLILKRFLSSFGYDCVEEISSPELEDIVKNEFEGKIENITDDIFRYLDGNKREPEYDKEYIDALVELQGIILYKSSMIQVTKELCEELCALIHDETTLGVRNKKTNQVKHIPKKVLTDIAKDGTAMLLKDCFYEPETFLVNYIKNYKAADINKIVAFTQKLNRLYTKGKKENLESFSNIDESVRLGILFSKFLEKIGSSEEMLMLFSIAFPNIVLQEGNSLEECITEEGLKTIKCIKQSNIIKNKEQLGKIRNLLAEGEKCLEAEDRKQYQALLYKKIGERYNGATNPSKKDSLYKKINELLDIIETEYRMLKVADDLANARFSTQGKSREYLYIFAIAFNMTASGYNENSFMEDEGNADPRKITDIQKNLFYDYYADNIINNLPMVSGLGVDTEEPDVKIDGYGINYKNFAEVTFLWCLNQKEKTAKEKLRLAYEIIKHCKKNGKSGKDFKKADINNSEEKTTQIYKEHYDNIGIKITEKTDFQEFLIKNYPCRFNGNIMKVNGSNLSAGKELEKQQKRVMNLLQRVEAEIFEGWDPNNVLETILERDNEYNDITRLLILRHYLRESRCKNCNRRKGGIFPNCYAFFEPYSWLDKDGKEQTILSCKDYCAEKKCDIETLRKSLKNIVYIGDDCEGNFERRLTTLSSLCNNKQSNLKIVLQEIEKRVNINVLYFEKKDVSRTALIALCYFEMVLMNYLYRSFCETLNKAIRIETFEEFYKAFCNGRNVRVKVYNDETDEDEEVNFVYPGANSILEKAGYQKVNYKNMFDIYVVFLAFKDNYKKLFKLPDASELIGYAKRVNQKLKMMKKEIELNRKNENNISKDR